MQLSDIPNKLLIPFAEDGGKNTIPTESQIGITGGRASLTDGFPPVTRIPTTAGGIPPFGLDMNGILYAISSICRWQTSGAGFPYDADFATDPLVGGYPAGARVLRDDAQGYWLNTTDDNETDPSDAGAAAAGWVPDFAHGVASVTMTSSHVTLTPDQYGLPIIEITGTLTTSLNLIFPEISGSWIVIDKTAGAFFVTAKTASGSGVLVSKNEMTAIACNSADIYIEKKQWVTAASIGADATGAASCNAAILAASTISDCILFTAGAYKISASIDIPALVIMQKGARLVATSGSVSMRFGGGFDAPLCYVLDTDGPTQFIDTKAIFPQWFGECGLKADDSTIPLTRAFRAVRAGSDGTSTPDSSTGCRVVRMPFGVYRCNDVPVYSGTVINGDAHGSLVNSLIQQIDITKPALYICPKNYGLDDSILNNSVGQNFFNTVGFRSESINDAATNAPIIKFLSPAQATTLLAIAGDSAGAVGHVDSMLENCWFKDSAGACIACDEGTLLFQLKSCVFDVVRQGVRFFGAATGGVKSYQNFFYGCIRGVFENSSGARVDFDSYADEFNGAGNCYNAQGEYQHAINWAPTAVAAGSRFRMSNSFFVRNDDLGTRLGGNIVANAELVNIDNITMIDPDGGDLCKGVAIGNGVKYLKINGNIVTDDLNSYTNSRLLAFSQSTQSLLMCSVSLSFCNTNVTAIANAVQSDYALTGCDFNCRFIGTISVTYNYNIVLGVNNSIGRVTNEIFFSAAPATGTFAVGDRVVNSAPAVGQPKAWVCTVAGTPGTWVSEGNL